jgi:hypothetical protein
MFPQQHYRTERHMKNHNITGGVGVWFERRVESEPLAIAAVTIIVPSGGQVYHDMM